MNVVNKGHRMHATDFRLLRHRAHVIPPSAIDARILPLIQSINKCEELVTIWSCEGHDDNPGWDEAYIMLGVRNPDHIDELARLFRWFMGDNQHLMGITQTMRANFLRAKHPKTGEEFWWPVWNLHWKTAPGFDREAGWTVADKVAKAFVEYLETVDNQ